MKLTLTILIVFIASYAGFAQVPEFPAGMKDTTVLYEKVYLHSDREYYAPGDTLWFKSYLVSGLNNTLELGYKNVYVQLISPKGKVISNRVLISVYGTSHGDISLNDSLTSGQYTIRAFTRYLENFDEKSSFHKRIWIGKSGDFNTKDSTQEKKQQLGEVFLLPEGGTLIENATNYVAFKAIGTDGKAMEISGSIINQEGQTLTSFKTSFMGMGQFILMPKKGESYRVSIDNHPGYNCQLPQVNDNGISFHCEDAKNEILVFLSRNYNNTRENFTLLASHKGTLLFSKTIDMDGYEKGLRLSKS